VHRRVLPGDVEPVQLRLPADEQGKGHRQAAGGKLRKRRLRPVAQVPGADGLVLVEQDLDVLPPLELDAEEALRSMLLGDLPGSLLQGCAMRGRGGEDEVVQGRLEPLGLLGPLGLLDLGDQLCEELLVRDPGGRAVQLALNADAPRAPGAVRAMDVDARLLLAPAADQLGGRVVPHLPEQAQDQRLERALPLRKGDLLGEGHCENYSGWCGGSPGSGKAPPGLVLD
jgi:hypothetical protein